MQIGRAKFAIATFLAVGLLIGISSVAFLSTTPTLVYPGDLPSPMDQISSATASITHVNSMGFIKETLVLFNNTIMNGNYLPQVENVSNPMSIAFDWKNNELYVTASPDKVYVINSTTNEVTDVIEVGNSPYGISVDPESGNVYVANSGSGNVSIIDCSNNSVLGSVKVGNNPEYLAYDPVDRSMFVTDAGFGITYLNDPGNVSVISTLNNTVTSTIPLGAQPAGIAFDPANKEVYVAEYAAGYVYGINISSSIWGHFSENRDGGIAWVHALAFDPSNNEMYIGGLYGGLVYAVNSTNKEVASAQEGYPFSMFFDPENNYMYVVNSFGSLMAINSTTNINVGSIFINNINGSLSSGTFDPYNGLIYVADPQTGAITLLQTSGPSEVTFTVKGIPSGTPWSVSVNGFQETSTGNSIQFNEPNGSYDYSFSAVNGYFSIGENHGNISLNGSSVEVSVSFVGLSTFYFLAGGISTIVVAVLATMHWTGRRKPKH